MQKVELNKETGKYELVNIDGSPVSSGVSVAEPVVEEKGPTTYLELIERRARRRAEAEDQAIEAEISAASRGEDDRPVFAQNAGQFFGDLGKIAFNAPVALATDYVDLGLGVADVVGQTAQLLTGQRDSYNPDELFNDSDNPLTRWRREALKTETVAGQSASNLVRLGTAIVSLPKLALKSIAAPSQLLSKAPKIGKTFGKVANAIGKADDALKTSRAPKVTKAMEALDLASKGGNKAAKAVVNNDWLAYTFKDIAKSAETANWWKGVSNSAAALTSIKKVKGTKAKIRTVGEALGWDAFVAFNVFGEGQNDFDETLTDFLAENNLPRIGYFETDVLDSSIERKWKQMLEGVITAAPMSAMIDMIRIRKFSKAFNAASDADKAKIVAAFNDEAEDLGRGFSRFFDDGADDAGKGFSQLPITNQSSWESMRPGFDPSLDPWAGGALARLNTQSDLVRLADQNVTNAEGLQAAGRNLSIPTGMTPRLGQGQQPLIEGADQAQLAGRTDAALPPGSSPEPKAGGVNQLDRPALRPGMDPVQGQPQITGRDQAQLAGRVDPALPPGSSPEPRPGGVNQLDRPALGAKGELVDARIEPARIEITPRNPDPTVTPQTIRTAFEEDSYRAFKRSMELTYEEVAPGQMQQVQRQIERLMPETRVDAIDYMKRNPITANELGVIDAPQSVWSNFIVNRGLFEGWAKIGEDMQIRFLRNPAANLDRGELAERSAKALDEAVDNELFNENLGRLIVSNNSDKVVDAKLKNNVFTTKAGEERFDLGEEVRLSAAEQAALKGASSDEEVVRQALGVDLADIKGPDVEKVEGSRGWVMLGEDGEELGRFTRKSQALKAAEKETDRLKTEAVNRARQIEADGMEQVMQTADINPVYTSDLTANVKLSKAQVDELLRYSDVVRKQIRVNKNTYTFSQGEMYDLIDGLTALKQTGEMKGNRLRVINNLIDKLDTQMKLLSPAARAIKQAQDLAVDAGRFLKNGEFC
jgi:hypothetical protein